MKRTLLLILIFLPMLASAQNAVEIDGIYYNLKTEEKTAEVTQGPYQYYKGDVAIPESVTYDDVVYNVTSIGELAFSECRGLISITIPDGVTLIGESAFDHCSGLTSVAIPNSVTSIGEIAFSYCRGLTSVTIPNSVTSIGELAFSYCSSLTSIKVEAENTKYDSRDNCNAIIEKESNTLIAGCQKTTIPNSVTAIGEYAFYGCDGLTSVIIPNGVTSIGDFAFYDCIDLTSVTIPNGTTSIGNYAFQYCSGLTSIAIGNGVTSIGKNAFIGCSGLISIDIPEGVTSIGDCAFLGCSGLTSITIPNSVISISRETFSGCSGLTSITIPGSVNSIGFGAFAGCSGLTSITIPNSVIEIGSYAFSQCSSLSSVTIPNSMTSIGSGAFYDCSALTSITIPEGITSIGSGAFYDCSALTSITIPEGITSIGNNTFAGCSSLTSITIPDGMTSIGESAFEGCSGLTSITIPNSVTTIGKYAIKCCSGLTSITIPNGVTSIDEATFYECSGLTSITIPGNVTTIGQWAFYGCSNLLDMFCYAENVPNTGNNVFNRSNIANATLHVPAASMDAYKAAEPWKQFKEIVALPDLERKMLEQGKTWVYEYHDFDEEEEFDHDEEVFDVSYTIQGDTVIGGVSYVKLMRQQDGVSTYYAALREEGTAVFRVMAGKSNEYKSLEFDPTKLSSMPNIYCDYTEHKEVIKVNGREFVRHIYEAVDEPLIFPRLIAVEGVGFRTVGIFGVFQELPTCHCDYESFKACYEDGECIFTNEDFEYTDPQTNVAYRPFVEDGKGWKVGYGSDNPIQFVEYYYFDSDTIIDGKVCKQMMCQRYVSPDYPEYDVVSQQPSLRYVGAWYEEDKKVYVYNTTDKQFKLMYDFSVDDNATLQIHGQSYEIGPKQSGGIKGFKGVYRDVMMVWDEEQNIYNTTWLEGVGGIEGPEFNVYLGEEYHGGAFLMSCTVGDEVIYLNDDYEDGATPDGARKRRFDFTHTIKIQPKARIKREKSDVYINSSERDVARPKVKARIRRGEAQSLYGEYNDQQLGINLDPLDDAYQVSITDESDKVVYEKIVNAGSIVALNIDISAYAKGLYTVTVENNSESFTGEFKTETTGIDVDGDGILTAKDIIAVVNVIAGKTTDDAIKSAADVNGDGVVNVADIIKIANKIVR